MKNIDDPKRTKTKINNVFLAPMDGYTDSALRETLALNSTVKPDMLFTEFVNVEAMTRDIPNTKRILHFTENQRPVIAQLFGKNPDAFYRATQKVIAAGFDGLDINMGCTAHKIANRYEGAGLINHPDLAVQIIEKCRQAINESEILCKRNFTFSVKTRLGYMSDTADTWLPLLDKQNLDFITLHGRFVQWYAGQADWERIGYFAKNMKTPVVGNGDIKTIDEAYEKQEKYGFYATMIGRNGQIFLGDNPKNRIKASIDYLQFHKNTQTVFYKGDEFAFAATKKVLLWILKGIDDWSELKTNLMHATNYDEAIGYLTLFGDKLG